MNERMRITIRYRVYCWIGKDLFYANRTDAPLPNVRWSMKKEEYPDHFDIYEASLIMNRYLHLRPHMEEVPFAEED